MKKHLIWLLPVLVLLGVASWWLLPGADNSRYPGMGGDFTLQSARGAVSLRQFRGQWVLIYFGYTSCPDICPASLGALSAALRQLDNAEMARIQPLFISVDPERDKLDRLAEYARYFHPKMLGLTGKLDELHQLTQRYGAYFRKAPLEDSSLDYAVDHSSTIFVVNEQGQLADMIHNSHSPQAILKHLRQALHGQ